MSSQSGSFFRDRTAHPLAGYTVLQIIPEMHAGAAARASIDIAAALSRVGANALVAGRAGPMVSELQAKGGVFVAFPAHSRNPFAMTLNVRRLARLIEAERVDIVHVRSRAAAWVAYGATRLTKTPCVTSFQTGFETTDAFAARYNSVLARGDVIIADSAYAAERIAARYPAARGKLKIARRGVDCRVFSPQAVSPDRVRAIRTEWGAAPDESIVLLAAGAAAAPDHKVLIEAARILIGKGVSGTKCIIAGGDEGGGRLARDLDRAIAKAQLQGIVLRTSPIRDLPAALLAASVVIALSSLTEDGAALEAQAMGTPVIRADAGASHETILAPPEVDDSARTGWRAPLADPAALAATILTTLDLGATAKDRLSLRARAHIESRYSLEQSCRATLDAYCAARRGRQT
ncbi:glycosyltransferase [Methylocapsa palsarum]|uniref:Glycosyltransferase involved in cell wall bisynthesis n=1 Tax=Methylocapsa palsarum TaxID=1612308 RepID=A0A1I3Y7E3_9HYPH|nr:glycosyltransferase [Methylocapsa palsarum]SFK27191.1 Glycosyltransferase involved in cell wall bisynthesis [Methylocapsa palsarum]